MQLLKDLFRKKTVGGICLVILILFLFLAIFADVIAPTPMVNDTLPIDLTAARMPPFQSWEHPLGTDTMGQDLLSYMIYGARTSVILCVSCTVLSTLISVVIGVLSAVIGGWFDLVVQRIVDAFGCIPQMLLLLLLMAMLGNGIPQMIFALAVPSGIGGSRMVRSSAMAVKDSVYCQTSDLLGGSVLWKCIKHVVPNIMPLVIISAAGSLGGVVMMEASMNFLGYGVDYANLGVETANMIRDILVNGADPATTPVLTFDNGTATINTETCEALGLDLDTVKEAFKPYCTEIVEVTTAENFS